MINLKNKWIAATLLMALATTTLAPSAHAARKPNFGLYVQKYNIVVGTNADFLIHPTGEYEGIGDRRWKEVRDLYEPIYRKTDDMDTTVLELHEQGWVMIGYAAFSSVEARDEYLHDGMTPAQRTGTKLGLRIRGIDPYADPKGDPLHAAIWANATMVVEQEGYAFSRLETKKDRIIASDGRDRTVIRGQHRGSYGSVYGGGSSGRSSTGGEMRSDGSWDQDNQEVSASAGTDGASVEGSAGQAKGSNQDRTRYKENTRFSSVFAGMSEGGYEGSHSDTIETKSQHWATALIDKHVAHYDYMVTFWKKADVNKLVLGAFTETLPRDLMRQIGTRHARMVRAVIGGTPAYDADIWDGDILLAIDGEPIRGATGYGELLERHAGREVTLTVWREGQVFDLPVELNQPR
jgi:hypothetical protein